jgi:hypothetical protein
MRTRQQSDLLRPLVCTRAGGTSLRAHRCSHAPLSVALLLSHAPGLALSLAPSLARPYQSLASPISTRYRSHGLIIAERALYPGSPALGKFYIVTDGDTHPAPEGFALFWPELDRAVRARVALARVALARVVCVCERVRAFHARPLITRLPTAARRTPRPAARASLPRCARRWWAWASPRSTASSRSPSG